MNYIYMPWISPTFKHEYLDSVSNRNVILRYNYEDLFIMRTGFGLTYNNGVFDVPTKTYAPTVIDKDNVDFLVEAGMYAEDEIFG